MTVNIQICFAEVEYPYVDKISMDEYKEKYEKVQYVGDYYFKVGNNNPYETEEGDSYPYGNDFEASIDGETWFNLNIATDDQPSIFYGNNRYVFYDRHADDIPQNKLYEGLRSNYPLYILDENLNVINKWDAEGYKRCIGFIDGYFYIMLQYAHDRTNVVFYKTADGVNLIDITETDEFTQAFKKRLYQHRLFTGMIYNTYEDLTLTTNNVKYKITYEIQHGALSHYGGYYNGVLQVRNYDSYNNVIEHKITVDGLNFYDVPLDMFNFFTTKNYIYANTEFGHGKTEMYRIDVAQLMNNITVIYDDKILSFATPPVIENDRTLVPMRFLFEQMGAEVSWDGATRTAVVEKASDEVSFSIDNTTARVNNVEKTMDVPARLVNEKTMIPLRFLSEELGYHVEWDEATKTVYISKC